ncbi:MAG: GTP pyrophosphokinase family protein, partial [Streptococcus vestibularis]|nr:GTP pyrophosphokinase family protein [Streptococcus vestibularis]
RTIAQDSWASLEHQMKYKHDIKNPEMITRELKRCADELASCDLTMQTIRNLIQEGGD